MKRNTTSTTCQYVYDLSHEEQKLLAGYQGAVVLVTDIFNSILGIHLAKLSHTEQDLVKNIRNLIYATDRPGTRLLVGSYNNECLYIQSDDDWLNVKQVRANLGMGIYKSQ